MDTSKEYIEMCHKATEIQEQWGKQEGDVFAAGEHTCKDFSHAKLVTGVVYEHIPFEYKCGSCGRNFYAEIWWLPRQDQLQDMFNIGSAANLLASFIEDFMYHPPEFYKYLDSMEKLWLGYYMQEQYGKTWNGSEWVEA